MASIAIVLKKNKTKADGRSPIYYRIIHLRKSYYISSEITIEERYWDENKGRVRTAHINSGRINHHLSKTQLEIHEKMSKQLLEHNCIDIEDIKSSAKSYKSIDFFKYCEPIVLSYKVRGIETDKSITSTINAVRKFVGRNRLNIEDINYQFAKQFELFLKTERNLKGTTIYGHFKNLNMIFKRIVQDKIIPYSSNPFLKYKIKKEKATRHFLTEEEIGKMIAIALPERSMLKLTRDVFIFACYCGGMRISDIIMLQKTNFNGTHIKFTSQKTTTQQHLKVPTKALEIIKYYENPKIKNQFLFPLLSQDIDLEDNHEVYVQKRKVIQTLNKHLKLITAELGIEKKITFHCSRHTFATSAISKGISIDKVSKLLGHSTIAQTLEYAKIVNNQVDNAMDMFN